MTEPEKILVGPIEIDEEGQAVGPDLSLSEILEDELSPGSYTVTILVDKNSISTDLLEEDL